MIAAPNAGDVPAPPIFPPRRYAGNGMLAAGPVETFLASLAASLEGQLDSALEADGIITPLGCVARATLVEAIGADLEAAVRDLMLAGVPREQAEARAVAELGPAPQLGRDLLVARRRRAVEAWQRGRESVWWWTEPLLPVATIGVAVFLAAMAPTLALVAGIAAEPVIGVLAVALVPLVGGVIVGVAETLAGDIDVRHAR